ncbi:MAG: phosphatidylglycerophosphatase A [Gammaproteobacteria bacterium]
MAGVGQTGRTPRELWRDPGHLLSFGLGSGLIRQAPGTWGSLVGVGCYGALQPLGAPAVWGAIAVMGLAGIALCGRTSRALGVKDHGAIVWDEIVGVMIALTLAEPTPGAAVACFLLFRALDILKPWPIRVLDQRLGGGFGVMADDVAAGALAGLAILLFKYLS